MEKSFIEKLKGIVKPFHEKVGGHDFEHSERVYNSSMVIGKEEDADLEILGAAAILHDIARGKADRKEIENHAKEGARMAKEILKEINFPNEKIDAVCYAIEVHGSSANIEPKTKEAAILQDADRLEALGAINVSRVFAFDGKNNIPIHIPGIKPREKYIPYTDSSGISHFYEKTLRLKPETFKTKKAKEMAKHRYEFSKQFVEEFLEEWDGKK